MARMPSLPSLPRLPDAPHAAGVTVREILAVPAMAGATVIAGATGLDRVVRQLNVMEVPDILQWTKPGELLLTTGYPLRRNPEALVGLICDLDDRGLAGIAIKVGRYLSDLPPEVLAEADKRGIPLIRLPEHVGFDDIFTQALTEILRRQSAALARVDDVHRALVQIVLDGGGLRELADALVALLGRGGVIVTTPDGRVLVEAGEEEPLARLHELTFEASGRFRTEAAASGLRLITAEGPTSVCVRIVAGALDHGRIVAVEGARRLTEGDVATLESAAMVAALAITKTLAVEAVETKYQGDFLRDLLTGRVAEPEAAAFHAASLGWDFDRPTVVVVAEIDPGQIDPADASPLRPAAERFSAAWRGVVRQADRAAAVGVFRDEVIAVVGASSRAEADRLARSLVAQVSGDGGGGRKTFSTGVSRVTEGAAALADAYAQARKAVQVGRQMHGHGAVAHFDELGVHRLLSLIPDRAELRSFVAETLGDLGTQDDAETRDLRHTLEVLLETNCNVAESARLLHYHYNTLRYRIGKLERMLGSFTTDPSLRLSLMVALRAISMGQHGL